MAQQAQLLRIQQELAERVGEPVPIGIRLIYDDWFEVEIHTFTDRVGLAAGRNLENVIEEAAVMMLVLDRVVTELRPAWESSDGVRGDLWRCREPHGARLGRGREGMIVPTIRPYLI